MPKPCDVAAPITAKTSTIYTAILRSSPHLHTGNFASLDNADVAGLFNLYDELFFQKALSQKLSLFGPNTLTFRLSSTMTRAGGKTAFSTLRLADGSCRVRYEIAIAIRMLFMNFNPGQRPVTVGGLICNDRLQALQRILEHEIIHLLELLESGKSSCAAPAFKTVAGNLFGHTQTSHTLISTQEIAAVQHALRVGSVVEFDYQGIRMRGRVNRIHHRATVLVNTADGMLYSDGHHYRKYYCLIPTIIIGNKAVCPIIGEEYGSLERAVHYVIYDQGGST